MTKPEKLSVKELDNSRSDLKTSASKIKVQSKSSYNKLQKEVQIEQLKVQNFLMHQKIQELEESQQMRLQPNNLLSEISMRDSMDAQYKQDSIHQATGSQRNFKQGILMPTESSEYFDRPNNLTFFTKNAEMVTVDQLQQQIISPIQPFEVQLFEMKVDEQKFFNESNQFDYPQIFTPAMATEQNSCINQMQMISQFSLDNLGVNMIQNKPKILEATKYLKSQAISKTKQ